MRWLAGLCVSLIFFQTAFAQNTRAYEYDALGRMIRVAPSAQTTIDPAFGVNGQWWQLANSPWGPNWGSQSPQGDSGTGSVKWKWIETLGASQLRVQVMTGPDSSGQRLKVEKSQDGSIIYDQGITSDAIWTTINITLPPGTTHLNVTVIDDGAGWGQWSAVAPLRFGFLPTSVPSMPFAAPTLIQPAWSGGGSWPDMSPWGARWSSHVTYGDAGTGKVVWSGLPVAVGRRLEFLAQTGPTTGQQRILLRNTTTGTAFVDITVTDTIHQWTMLTFDVPANVTAVDVEVQDNGGNWGEWIAVTTPRLL